MRRWLVALLLCGCGDDTVGVPPPDFAVEPQLPDLATPVDLWAPNGPMLLSQTGLYSDFANRTVAPGIISYAPRYPLWSDGSDKQRYLWVPPGTQVDTSNMDDWLFPIGTKLWKEFTVPTDGGSGITVETRMLEKQIDDKYGWWMVAYVWRADGSDAVATPAGADDPLGTIHRVPSQNDCYQCHDNRSDVPIGVSAIQLSSPDGKSGALSQLAAANLLSAPPPTEFQPPGQGVVQDALGYLHGNCGHCHNSEWGLATKIHLSMRLFVDDATPELTAVYRTGIDKPTGHDIPGVGHIAIVPGDPDHSQLYARMGHRADGWEMPPVCTKLVDSDGRRTIHDWIAGLQ